MSCSNSDPDPEKPAAPAQQPPPLPEVETISGMELYLMEHGLVNVQDSAAVLVELKYSTADNFMGFDLYGDLERCYLQPDVAGRIAICQRMLDTLKPGWKLLIYDGVRPRHVQQLMWDTLDMPLYRKTRYVSNPVGGSLHNFGAAVDITLADERGIAVDMGAPYDDTSLTAWPVHELRYLQQGLLTQQQVSNRQLLRRVMTAGRFFNIQSEWWHFNACRREEAEKLYKMVE
jgi:D-alanyl-D-alanine dipeptidase